LSPADARVDLAEFVGWRRRRPVGRLEFPGFRSHFAGWAPLTYVGTTLKKEMPMPGDAEIARAVLRGDREAFAALVARHERAVWATAWRVLRDHHAAADVAQEAFLQAFQRLGDLRRPERFGVWLLRIARRESIRLARRRARDPCRSLDEAAIDDLLDRDRTDDPATTPLSADSEDLLAAVARLPEHERLVVVLRYLDGHSVAEVAAAIGRPVGTITKQLSRAIERLKRNLREVIS
jgi:RNA polymerase sigma-70 factor (ECF subfamily)